MTKRLVTAGFITAIAPAVRILFSLSLPFSPLLVIVSVFVIWLTRPLFLEIHPFSASLRSRSRNWSAALDDYGLTASKPARCYHPRARHDDSPGPELRKKDPDSTLQPPTAKPAAIHGAAYISSPRDWWASTTSSLAWLNHL